MASVSGIANVSYQYDAFGRRIGGGSVQYLFDGLNIVQELNAGTPSANLLGSFELDETFMRTDSTGARTLLRDALGSTIALTDSAGSVKTQYTYEPFGKTSVSGEANSNGIKYTGREADVAGMYYHRARFYSPILHRFVSQDPIGFKGGINLYAYVGNSPLNYIDPLGLEKKRKKCCDEEYLLCESNARANRKQCLIWSGVLTGVADGLGLAGCAFTGPAFLPCALGVEAIFGWTFLGMGTACQIEFGNTVVVCQENRNVCYAGR